MNANALKDPKWWTKIAVDLVDAKPASVAKDLSELLVGAGDDVNSQLAQLYMKTVTACLESQELTVKFPKKIVKNKEFEKFDPCFLTHDPYFRELLKEAENQVKEDDSNVDFEIIARQVREDFGQCFNHLRKMAPENYDKANRLIDLLVKGYDTPEGRVVEHINEILKKVGSDPLPIDPALTLWEIYVTPCARFWNGESCIHRNSGDEGEEIPDLMEALLEKVSVTKAKPIVIHGQPGHGNCQPEAAVVAMCPVARFGKFLQNCILSAGSTTDNSPGLTFREMRMGVLQQEHLAAFAGNGLGFFLFLLSKRADHPFRSCRRPEFQPVVAHPDLVGIFGEKQRMGHPQIGAAGGRVEPGFGSGQALARRRHIPAGPLQDHTSGAFFQYLRCHFCR